MMASGEVAKKIALFELKPKNHEHHCRLKRKHAIRRKRYRGKERRIVTHEGTSMIALSTSDEHLNLLLKSSDDDTCSSSSHYHQSCSSQFSASCSALFDLVSAASESSEYGGTVDDDSSGLEIIPSRRLFLKSATCKEKKLTKRLNIFDIDIEIKIEKKELLNTSPDCFEDCSCGRDERKPLTDSEKTNCSIKKGTIAMLTPSVAVSAERIRLTACLDDSSERTKSVNYNCAKFSHDSPQTCSSTSKTNHINELIKNGSNNNTNYDERTNNSDNEAVKCNHNSSPEPLYENILCFTTPPPLPPSGPPPLPPKRLFGDSFTTNYSCLPATFAKNPTVSTFLYKSKPNFEENKTINVFSTESTDRSVKSLGDSVIETLTITTKPTCSKENGNCLPKIDKDATVRSGKPLLPSLEKLEAIHSRLEPQKTKEAIQTNEEAGSEDASDDEPYYEDLYDYCTRSVNNGDSSLNPLLDLFRDQFHSLEQNVADEVEYCDCSTILALMTTESSANLNSDSAQNQLHRIQEHHRDQCLNKSYEIYDDCFGVDVANEEQPGTQISTDTNDKGPQGDSLIKDNTYERYTVDGQNVSNKERSQKVQSQGTGLSISHTLADYIKATVAKASTPISWRKMSSPAAERGVTEQCRPSDSQLLSPLAASSPFFAMFPSLSSSKKKLIEAEGEAAANKENSTRPQDILQKEAIAAQTDVENERNANTLQNERNQEIKTNSEASYDVYGIFNYAKNNGNGTYSSGSKPKFGGRPVIAHPVDAETANRDDTDGQSRQGEDSEVYQNSQVITNDGQPHNGNKKDDNEIFNKPLPLPPPNASTYESLYEEPIYGITNQLTTIYSDKSGASVSGTTPGRRRSSAPAAPPPFSTNKLPNGLSLSKPGSTYSHSPSISSGSTYGYSSGSVNEYGETSSASKYGPSSFQTVTSSNSTVSTPLSPSQTNNANHEPIYGMNEKLPPTPPSKFSSIAKTAGRKIAKKFLGIRKTSKCGLDEPLSVFHPLTNPGDSDSGTCQSPSTELSSNGSTPQPVSSIYSPSNAGKLTNSYSNSQSVNHYGGSTGSGMSGNQIRRPISRPSIPPPEPPKNDSGNMTIPPPVLPDKVNNYSIYADNHKNDDDYDDSDFYDSDSELIRNFVSQVQPIYSMEEEPLYQYYTYGISLKPDDDYQPVIPKNLGLTLDMLVPRVGQRTLWCELPGVLSSGILSILSDKQKQLQEAIFEILTSEVSYLKSLDVLISLFAKHEELLGILNEEERGYLFGNIDDVRDCSQAFLSELLGKWEESWYIQEIGEIICRNTNTKFSVYKDYCRNKIFQDKTLQRLRNTRDEFVAVVKSIEEDSKCQMLQIDSFLMLPMQRITRLPLLVNAVIQRTAAGKEKSKCEEALKCLTNLVLACNDAARESQDAEETMAILDKLEFTRGIKALPDLGPFIMKGDFMKNPFDQGRGNQINWTFRKAKRTFYWLFLFSKQLLVARKKANGRFEIIDMIDPAESSIKPLPNLEGVSKELKNFMLYFSKKETVYFLAAKTNSEIDRWKSKLETMKPKEELRVEAIFPYDARRPDEMSFFVGDLIRVSQIQPDGWYFGTKLATGDSGWFPGNYCCENAS